MRQQKLSDIYQKAIRRSVIIQAVRELGLLGAETKES
jgi:hypothetical protein